MFSNIWTHFFGRYPNDSGEFDPSQITIVDGPSNGSIEVKPNGKITYWPNEDYTGSDIFEYQICTDATETVCDTAMVTIVVLETPCSVPVSGNDFDWTYPNNSGLETVQETMTQPATNAGFIFDIYKLDNSFNMNINGVSLAINEIEFQSNDTPGPINLRFQDGDLYETDTEGDIWEMEGDVNNPLIRVKIAADGSVSMYGSKDSGGLLYPLELFEGNEFKTIEWHTTGTNTIEVSQNVVGVTLMRGRGYGLNAGDIPVILVLNEIDPTCENGEALSNGSIELELENLVDGVYDFEYDGGVFEGVFVENGVAVIEDLPAGEYNNIVIGSGTCQSPQGVNAILVSPECSCIEVVGGGSWHEYVDGDDIITVLDTFEPIVIEGGSSGVFFDIYNLDNSFDLKVNGVSIASHELQFDMGTSYTNAPTFNVRFMDGDLYKYDTPSIWQIIGTETNPMLRVEISSEGEVSLYGSKESGGALYKLRTYNGADLNVVPWNVSGENILTVTQDARKWTRLRGKVYGIDMCEQGMYELTKTADVTLLQNAQVGDIITYTLEVTNIGNDAIAWLTVVDPLFDEALQNPSNDELASGQSWTYVKEYAITAQDIEAGGVYNQATVFGVDSHGNAIPTVKSYDPVNGLEESDPNYNANCATCTFTAIESNDGCEVRYSLQSTDPFYWIYGSGVAVPSNPVTNSGTLQGTNGGFIFDIYRLDNSFNLEVNGEKISDQELEFQKQSIPGINIRFKDGDRYEVHTPKIYLLKGDAQNPMLRVVIGLDGSVRMFGSKTHYGELYELELISGEFNTVDWYADQENSIVLSQSVVGRTAIDADGYGIHNTCPVYRLEKTANFEGDVLDAEVGDKIVYTFEVKDAIMPVHNLRLEDELLGGEITNLISGDANANGILDTGETWIYEAEYFITAQDIARGGVYNQAVSYGNDVLGLYLSPVLSTDPTGSSQDPSRADYTYVALYSGNCDDIQYEVADINYNVYANSGYRTTSFDVLASNGGFVLDIYSLDNSFNLNVNGTEIALEEIEFQSRGTSGINVAFADGDRYEKETPYVYLLKGDQTNPMLRVEISRSGEVSLYGSKSNYGNLEPLVLTSGNALNTVPWNNNAENALVLTQKLVGRTVVKGSAYVISSPCGEGYAPYSYQEPVVIEELPEGFEIALYPNPVQHTLYIEATSTIEEVSVYNMLGQQVRSERPNGMETRIDMEGLQSDTYLIRVQSEGKTETYRVVKK